jgi:archaellum component FlaC
MDNFFATPARMLGLDVPKPEPLIDLKDKEDQDRRMSYGKLVERSSKATQETLEAAKKGNQLTAIDVELANLDTQMSGLYSSGSPDAVKLADINERKKAKTVERSRVTEELAPLQSKAQDNVNETKNAVKTLEDQFAKGQIPSDTYNELMPAAKSAAKDAEAAQRKYNESIKSGLDNLTPWLKTLDKIVARFEDIGIASGIAKDRLAIARNDREIGGKITRGGSERQAVRDNEAVITREIEQRRRAVSELTDSLNANNPNNVKAVQAAYSLDDNSTSGQIKLAASGTTNLSDKTTLEKLAVRKDEQNKIESLDAGVSNSHAETYRRIRAENREAALYYTSLAQQIDPTGNAFARVISGMSREKNKFLSKLNNYGTGGFDAYTDAVIELMDITRERMAAQAKAAKDKKDAFDAATNRRNEDAGKRDSDFDTSEKGGKPGKPPAPRNVSQPAAIQGTIQSSQPAKANTPRPNAGASPVANVGSIPKKIKVIKYEKITDSSGYLNSNKSLAPSLGGAFKRLSPVEKKRFLTTSMSANGETDLGFDMRDPSEAALANKLKAKKKNKPVVYSIPYEVEIDNPAYIAAQKRATASKKVGKSIVTTKKSVPKGITAAPRYNDGGRETTTDWRNKSAVLSNRIASDAAAKADRELTDSFDAANLREKKTSRDLERKARLAAQAARKQVRDQNMAQLDSIPVTSVQESQERERMKQQNSFIENREGLTDQITNMVGQIQGFKESINYLGGKKNRTPTESAALSKMLKDLPTTEKILQSLQDQASNLPRTEELAMAKLAENQKYQVEKLKESEELDRKSAERTAIGNDLTNVDQQLTNSPYSEGLRLSKRNLEEKGGNLDAEMARTRAMRAIEDRKREDSSYLPERQKADKRRAEQNYRGAIKNTGQKRSQDSVRTQNELDSEIEKNRIAEQRITDADTGLDIRSREAADKTDAPFANTKAIELKSAQNLAAIDLMLSEKTEQYKELKIKYAGNAQLLASIARQQAESERQIDTEKKILSAETEVSATEVQKQRKAFLYGQQQATAGLEASSRKSTSTELKQRGQDTREFDYRSDVFNRQVETSKTVFDLEQQKASITGITPEAKQAREEIDKLIKGFYDLEASDLSNMAAQFDRLNEVIGETQKATTGVLTEFVKTGKFDWKKILTTGLDKGIEQIMGQVVPNLFGGLYRKPAAVNNATSPNLSKLPPVLDLLPSGPSKQGRWSNITLDTQPMSSPLQPKLDTQPMRSPLQPKIDTPSTPVSVVLAGKEGIAPIPVTIEGGIPPAPTSQYEGMLAGDESLNKYGSAEYIQGAAIAPQITIAPQILGAVGGLLSGGGKGGRGLGLSNILGGLIGGGTGSMLGSIGGLFGFADGGIVPKDSRFNGMRSGNDPIAKALRKEGNNSVIAALTPGERVLTLSESRYYQAMFPRGIEGYKDGGVVGNVRPIPLSLDRGKIDNRGDNNEFNFNIGGDSGDKRGQMDKGQIKDFENAVTAVLLKHKRAKTGLS